MKFKEEEDLLRQAEIELRRTLKAVRIEMDKVAAGPFGDMAQAAGGIPQKNGSSPSKEARRCSPGTAKRAL